MAGLLYEDEVYAIVGAAMDVYNDPGPGFLENVYQEAMKLRWLHEGFHQEPFRKFTSNTREDH